MVWTLAFRVSYCRMAAAPKEQPVNWHGVRPHATPSFCPKPSFSISSLLSLVLTWAWTEIEWLKKNNGRTYPHGEHQRFEKLRPEDSGCRWRKPWCASFRGWRVVCFLGDIAFLCIWPSGFTTETTPLLVESFEEHRCSDANYFTDAWAMKWQK